MRAKGSGQRPAVHRYEPPPQFRKVDARSVGLTNGLALKFPYLYIAGDEGLLSRPSVAIVGSRKVTDDGKRRAAKLARAVVDAGMVVMSGLAEGVDFEALTAAMARGRVIAVIGTPLETAYPAKHAALQERIYREHLLVSPYEARSRVYPSNFPERNRVMARLSRATVIVEAGDTSGTLHQAAECLRVGRPLFILRSVVDNPDLTWPTRFVGHPGVHVLDESADVIAEVCA